MLKMDIKGVLAVPMMKEPLTAGRVGLRIEFTFSHDWDDLEKYVVFEGSASKDVALIGEDACVVPHEVLATAGPSLRVGVYGMKNENDELVKATPTVWASFGRIESGAVRSESSSVPPTEDVVTEILEAARTAVETANDAKETAEGVAEAAARGDFKGDKGDTGDQGPAATIEIGTVTTGAPSDPASVTNIGTETAAIFNFTIPKGDKGDTGQQGQQGIQGPTGPTGDSGVYVGTDAPTDPSVRVWVDTDGTPDPFPTPQSSGVPQPLGTAARGTATEYSRSDHVHDMPTAANVGAIPAPASPSENDILKYVSGAWVADAGGGGSVSPYTSNPAALGTASPGSSDDYARGDHVHENNIFWALYDMTTSAEIQDAIDADKEVLVNLRALVQMQFVHYCYLRLAKRVSDTEHHFSGIDNVGVVWYAHCISDTWTYNYQAVPEASNALPSNLGTASAGADNGFARSDHIHNMPSASEVGAIAAPSSPTSGDVLTYSGSAWAAAAPAHQIPSGGNAGECLSKLSASDYELRWRTINDWTPAGLMRTNGGTAAKVAEWSFWSATQYPSWLVVTVCNSNTYAGAITLKVNGSTAYPIYINGAASSATNYTLPAGSYFVYFDGSKFDFRTDGKIPGSVIGHADLDIAAPASPSSGDVLTYSGGAWTAAAPAAVDPTEVAVSTAGAVTQALDAGKIYHFTGALTALTITFNAAAAGQLAQYHFDFDEPSTAFDPTLPSGVKLPDGHTWEASTHYEVDILNNYAVVMAWAAS